MVVLPLDKDSPLTTVYNYARYVEGALVLSGSSYAISNVSLPRNTSFTLAMKIFVQDASRGEQVVVADWDVNNNLFQLSVENEELKLYLNRVKQKVFDINNFVNGEKFQGVKTQTWQTVGFSWNREAGRIHMHIDNTSKVIERTSDANVSLDVGSGTLQFGVRANSMSTFFDGKLRSLGIVDEILMNEHVNNLANNVTLYATNECSSSPCGVNGLSCSDAYGDFVCQCVPGYTGKTCDESCYVIRHISKAEWPAFTSSKHDGSGHLSKTAEWTCTSCTDPWVEVNLGKPSEVSAINVTSSDNSVESYVLTYSTDGAAYSSHPVVHKGLGIRILEPRIVAQNYVRIVPMSYNQQLVNFKWELYSSCVDCGKPPEVSFASSMYNNTLMGSTVVYLCSTGYLMSGTSTIECHENATWGNPPVCQPTCQMPPAISHGTVGVTSTVVGSEATYFCGQGYMMNGTAVVECQISLAWTSPPTCVPKTCPAPPSVTNASVVSSLLTTTVGSIVVYTCNQGYVLNGSSSIECRTTLIWTLPPTCEIGNCGQPPFVSNASVHFTETTYGSFANYGCDMGFDLMGNKSVKCQHNLTWSSPPNCILGKCGPPPNVSDASVQYSGTTLGSLANYSCHLGHEMKGNSPIECQRNLTWSTSPTCVIGNCGHPPSIFNGFVNLNSTTFGSFANYSCDMGYVLTSKKSVKCQYNFTWSTPPNCSIGSCGRPLNVSDASVQYTNTTLGSLAIYSCRLGYGMEGTSTVECLLNLTWSMPPKCMIGNCGRPPNVSDASVRYTATTYRSSATYSCQVGHIMKGNESIKCQHNLTWTLTPQCVIENCGRPPNVSNASVFYNKTTFGSNATYFCKAGYVLKGNTSINCAENLTWSSGPSCLIGDCGQPPTVENAVVTANSTTFGTKTFYSCNLGHVMQGNMYSECLENFTWTSPPNCVVGNCGQPPSVTNATYTIKSLIVGGSVVYVCDSGYLMKGPNQVDCRQNLTWSTPPTCNIGNCSEPPAVLNASVVVNSTQVGAKASYLCFKGYDTLGSAITECQRNLTWTRPPLCKRQGSCSHPPNVTNASVVFNSTRVGDKAAYSCADGFSIDSRAHVECQENFTWSAPPSCKPVSCGQPPNIGNASVHFKSASFGDRAVYTCKEGFIIEGQIFSQCLFNLTWSLPPICRPFPGSCGPPSNVSNATVTVNTTVVGSKAIYVCKTGFIMTGSFSVECQRNFTWTANPVCTLSYGSCGEPPSITNGAAVSNYTSVGAIVAYTCNPGFTLLGIPHVECSANLTWTTAPTCSNSTCDEPPTVPRTTTGGSSRTVGSKVFYFCSDGYVLNGTGYVLCQQNLTWTKSPTCHFITDYSTTSETEALPVARQIIDPTFEPCTTRITYLKDPLAAEGNLTSNVSYQDAETQVTTFRCIQKDSNHSYARLRVVYGCGFANEKEGFIWSDMYCYNRARRRRPPRVFGPVFRRPKRAPVEAPAAVFIGGTHISIILGIVGFIVFLDASTIVKDVGRLKKNFRHAKRKVHAKTMAKKDFDGTGCGSVTFEEDIKLEGGVLRRNHVLPPIRFVAPIHTMEDGNFEVDFRLEGSTSHIRNSLAKRNNNITTHDFLKPL